MSQRYSQIIFPWEKDQEITRLRQRVAELEAALQKIARPGAGYGPAGKVAREALNG